MLRYRVSPVLLLLFPFSTNAFALQSIIGKVTAIEVSYMPESVRFTLDQGNAACPAGKVLTWQNANLDNNKAVYAAVTAALASGQRIEFFIEDNDQLCKGRFIYIKP